MYNFQVGVELEIKGLDYEDQDNAIIIHNEFHLFGETKEDGSVFNGFEIATDILDANSFLPNKDEYISASLDYEELFATIRKNRLYVDKQTGMHVHIDSKVFEDAEITAIDTFICGNEHFISFIGQRTINKWCVLKTNSLEEIAKRRSDSKDRALNISKFKTLEFRFFASTIKLEEFYKNVQFCIALCNHAQENEEICLDSFKNYVKMNEDSYPELENYLRKYIPQ